MTDRARSLLVVGGGVAGLTAGIHALRNGFRTTILEHNLALGGVCTAWPRAEYLVDGCIHWLTGGPFAKLYEEVGVLPQTKLRVLDRWVTWRDVRSGEEIVVQRDLDATFGAMHRVAPDDREELDRMRAAVDHVSKLAPPIEAQELMSMRDGLRQFWEMRGALGTLLHFRKPFGLWVKEHIRSENLRRFLSRVAPETAPAFFFPMILGYLQNGWLSRPVGGTASFRDALVRSYRELGGEARTHATVDEILVEDGRARGVRLDDGTMIDADVVLSTSSTPETILRLLGGRYDAQATRDRMRDWKTFDPIVLASFGVARDYAKMPSMLLMDGITPFEVGGHTNEHLYLRVCNDDACFAPPGHTVVQAMVATDYAWWAKRGSRYQAEKEIVAQHILEQITPFFPEIRESLRMTDIATPLTYWSMARSWRGAYEGWMPNDASFAHVDKKLRGLEGFYMAGQWVEPGGGVPMAVMSGRQAIQLLCADSGRSFVAR